MPLFARRAWCTILVFALSYAWMMPVYADDEAPIPLTAATSTMPEVLDTSSSTQIEVPSASQAEAATNDSPTSTNEQTLIIADTSSTTISNSLNVTTTTLNATESPQTAIPSTESIFHPLLNLIAPAPIQGPEWVQFSGVDASSARLLIGWHLEDSDSTIFTFTSTTHFLNDPNTSALRIELKSARLNNTGDRVALISTDGEIVDETTYPAMQRDQRWARDGNQWIKAPEPITIVTAPTTIAPALMPTSTSNPIADAASSAVTTTTATSTTPAVTSSTQITTEETPLIILDQFVDPPVPIIIEEKAPTIVPISPSPPKAKTAITATVKKTAKKTTAKNSAEKSTITVTNAAVPKASVASTKVIAAKSTTIKAKTAKPKKISVKKAQTAPLFIDDFPMLSSLPPTRVRLTGVVGSSLKSISKNVFVLLNPDGKGLLVHKPSAQPSPSYQDTISVTGTIIVNDDGISLTMATKDTWQHEASSTSESIPDPRLVDLTNPSQEDAWSLVQVEGRVKELTSTRFTLDLDDGTQLAVSIKQSIGYRTSRLHKGDLVRVAGLLDTRADMPNLIPQHNNQVELLQEAEKATMSTTSPTEPIPWLPFGAAGTSVALTHSYHWFKKRNKEAALAAKVHLIDEKLAE